jgi:hypothetical protein
MGVYISYHQILLTYYPPNYAYDVDLRSSNKYYDASNNFKGGVPYTQWGGNIKYSHIYDGRMDSFSGGNTNLVSRNLIWQKLRPMLEEKYPKNKDENNLEYNNRLVNAFNEEVAEYLQIVKN